jgi:hypothetical protein
MAEDVSASRRPHVDWAVLLIVALVVTPVVAVIWYLNRGFTEDEAGLLARLSSVEHPAIAEVWRSDDTMKTVFVELAGSATDEDARDVWCEVIGQAAIDWHLQVGVQNDGNRWPAPTRCSDPSDVPLGGTLHVMYEVEL